MSANSQTYNATEGGVVGTAVGEAVYTTSLDFNIEIGLQSQVEMR